MIRSGLSIWEIIWTEKGRYRGCEKEHEEIGQGIIKYGDNITGTVWKCLLHTPVPDHCS